jgi:predicted RNA binding protein YcfA (HicA-like mRNA interferase family)
LVPRGTCGTLQIAGVGLTDTDGVVKQLPRSGASVGAPCGVSRVPEESEEETGCGPTTSRDPRREAIRAFLRAGGIQRGGKGDHVNVKMPNGCLLTIPGRSELKIGLLKDAIKKAGLTEEQFLELL